MKKYFSIVIGIIVITVIGFFAFSGEKIEKNEEMKNGAVNEQMIETKDEDEVVAKDFEEIIAKAPSLELKDVSESEASGTAWLAVYNGKTYHRVIAKNMPALPGTDFYEGWLVKSPTTGGFFSSGKMEYNPSTKEARLDFVIDGDKSDYRFVVITSEPDDGNPAPDKHIIEERYPENVDFLMFSDALAEKKESMVKTGTYETYSAEKIALAATDDVVIFFHASWCPSCRALNEDIEKNVSEIPAGVIILKTDYDKETELKKKYGVTIQHTLVQVDADGNLIKKWSGGSKLENLISQIQ